MSIKIQDDDIELDSPTFSSAEDGTSVWATNPNLDMLFYICSGVIYAATILFSGLGVPL